MSTRHTSRKRAAVDRGECTPFAMTGIGTPTRDRATTNNRARQPEAECPVCHTLVRQKKATMDESGVYAVTPGTRKGDLIMSSHRFGGGAIARLRGDAPCAGSKARAA